MEGRRRRDDASLWKSGEVKERKEESKHGQQTYKSSGSSLLLSITQLRKMNLRGEILVGSGWLLER